jgi:hypothetical protein
MRSEFAKHKIAYIALIAGLVGITLLFLAAWPNTFYQQLCVLALVVFYIIWGGVTHVKTDHFTKRVLSEYVGIGVLAGLLLLMIIS